MRLPSAAAVSLTLASAFFTAASSRSFLVFAQALVLLRLALGGDLERLQVRQVFLDLELV